MNVTFNPHHDQSVLFSRNAQDILVATEKTVTVKVGDYTVGTFEPHDGKLTVPLKEILRGYPFPELDIYAPEQKRVRESISIRDDDSGLTLNCVILKGGIPSDFAIEDLHGRILTPAPQVQEVYPWSVLFLSYLPMWGESPSPASTFSLEAELYFRRSGKKTMTISIYTIQPGNGPGCITCRVDIPGLRIGYKDEDTLLAMDFYRADNLSAIGTPLRFILAPSRAHYREFFFRNSYGVLDQLHSRGAIEEVLESEYRQFSRDEVLTELPGDHVRRFTVHTGRFRSTEERLMWLDFLRSDTHYMMEQDGTLHRIAIEESKMESPLLTTSEATFRFRYCEEPAGRIAERTELNPFDYDTEIL